MTTSIDIATVRERLAAGGEIALIGSIHRSPIPGRDREATCRRPVAGERRFLANPASVIE
jgi:hypothetical protein